MGHIEYTRNIAASPELVFAALADPARRGEWLTIHAGWLDGGAPNELAVGTKFVEKVVMLGMANKFEWVVDEVDAPKRLVTSATGMAGVKVRFEFLVEPVGEGSDVTIHGDFEGQLIVGALGKAVEKDGMKNLEESLAKLETVATA